MSLGVFTYPCTRGWCSRYHTVASSKTDFDFVFYGFTQYLCPQTRQVNQHTFQPPHMIGAAGAARGKVAIGRAAAAAKNCLLEIFCPKVMYCFSKYILFSEASGKRARGLALGWGYSGRLLQRVAHDTLSVRHSSKMIPARRKQSSSASTKRAVVLDMLPTVQETMYECDGHGERQGPGFNNVTPIPPALCGCRAFVLHCAESSLSADRPRWE